MMSDKMNMALDDDKLDEVTGGSGFGMGGQADLFAALNQKDMLDMMESQLGKKFSVEAFFDKG